MKAQMPFNPYSIENHYSLEMACYLLHQQAPGTVGIASNEPLVVQAAIRRLGWVQGELLLTKPELIPITQPLTDVPVALLSDRVPDAVLMPFSRRFYAQAPETPFLVTITHNAWSYKSLRYPGKTQDNLYQTMRWVKQTHRVQRRVGLFAPRFLYDWALSQAAGTRFPVIHFSRGQQAMAHIYETGPFWRLAYILVIAATA